MTTKYPEAIELRLMAVRGCAAESQSNASPPESWVHSPDWRIRGEKGPSRPTTRSATEKPGISSRHESTLVAKALRTRELLARVHEVTNH